MFNCILLQDYFHNIDIDNGLYCFGIKDTLYSLEAGAISKLIIFQDLDLNRYVLRDKENNEEIIFSKELKDNNKEIVEMELLTDWFSENYRNWGCKLHFISDCSAEGNKFKNCFGGIGGILRYVLPMEYEEEELSDFDLDNDFYIIPVIFKNCIFFVLLFLIPNLKYTVPFEPIGTYKYFIVDVDL